jgi:hypothetical protein
MSVHLSDFLIAVSDPSALRAFENDRQKFLSQFTLDASDLAAIEARSSRLFRKNAAPFGADQLRNSTNQFSTSRSTEEVVIDELSGLDAGELHAEVELTGENVTINEPFLRILDEDGVLYLAKRRHTIGSD